MSKLIVTGGAGFIGSALIRYLISETNNSVLNIDKLTYAGNLESLSSVSQNERYSFVKGDISDIELMDKIICDYAPDFVIHLAAESHVDRSIDGPSEFIQTNIVGTYVLLESVRRYWTNLSEGKRNKFRMLHVSTDEVYGTLGKTGKFTESSAYDPSSPYSASKASSDHLVRAWNRTYGLPILITNCSNNYGPYQYAEKFIPLMILNSLAGEKLPIYGDGKQVRDWLHVEDHARALYSVVTKGKIGETYNIGSNNEKTNLQVVYLICAILDSKCPDKLKKLNIKSFQELIEFVEDRPGHDERYAIDGAKLHNEQNWVPKETFDSGLLKTVEWYLSNKEFCDQNLTSNYKRVCVGSKTCA